MEGEGMSEELKPCPFCGGKARMHVAFASGGDHSVGVYVECLECRSCSETKWGDGAQEKAADAWNRRAERTCLAKPYEVDGETGFYDCIECECGEVNDVSARYCNGCGGLIEVVYE